MYWERYQERIFENLESGKDDCVVVGDGRHHSMGHSAKYGAYTMLCLNPPKITHFDLVQVIPQQKVISLHK